MARVTCRLAGSHHETQLDGIRGEAPAVIERVGVADVYASAVREIEKKGSAS